MSSSRNGPPGHDSQGSHERSGMAGQLQESGAGPMRTQKAGEDRDKKGPIAAPVKSACTFCRSRKSRCDGNKPCGACVARGRVDDCLYTVSRRGGKPKPKVDPSADIAKHLNKLFHLTDIPYAYRRQDNSESEYPAFPFLSGALAPPEGQSQPSFVPSTSLMPMLPDVQYPPTLPSAAMTLEHSHSQTQQHLPQQQHQQQQQQQPQQHQQHQRPLAFSSGSVEQQSHPKGGLFQDATLLGQSVSSSSLAAGSQHPFGLQQSQQPQPQQSTLSSGFVTSPGILQTWQGPPFLEALQTNGAPSQELAEVMNAGFLDNSATDFSSPTSMIAHPVRSSPRNGSAQAMRPLPEESVGVRSLLIDYYKYLFRFIPVLPGPRYIDVLSSTMQPESPFILALQCVLPLLRNEEQPIGAFHQLNGAGLNFGSEEKRQHLKERTTMMERKANDAIDSLLEKADSDPSDEKYLELIQTLCVMVIYEYGTGRVMKSRLKADQALGLAMAQGLHKLRSPSQSGITSSRPARSSFASTSSADSHSLRVHGVDPETIYEMRKRCWWVVWTLVLWSAYNTGRIPTIRADDPRVRSELPTASDPSAWTSNVASLQALLLVQDRVLALAHSGPSRDNQPPYKPFSPDALSPKTRSPEAAGSAAQSPFSFGRLPPARAESVSSSDDMPTTFHTLPSNASRPEILESMQEIDAFLQEQIQALEKHGTITALAKRPPDSDDLSYIEEELEESLRTGAAVQLYTSSLTLHIGQAFQGASLFERKLCFLNSINDNSDPSCAGGVCREPMPNAFYDELIDVAAVEGPHGIPAGLSEPFTTSSNALDGANKSPSLGQSQDNGGMQQDLFARGPFLPRLSLQRCVHASKKLLDIAKRRHGQSVNPNPFNCCSFVLISFVLLMQALAVHGGFGAVDDEADSVEDNDMDTDELLMGSRSDSADAYAHDLLQSGRSGQALDGLSHGPSDAEPHDGKWFDNGIDQSQSSSTTDPSRQAQLRGIWTRVREARDTLADIGKHWDAVMPMADEVDRCLETSQLLLSS